MRWKTVNITICWHRAFQRRSIVPQRTPESKRWVVRVFSIYFTPRCFVDAVKRHKLGGGEKKNLHCDNFRTVFVCILSGDFGHHHKLNMSTFALCVDFRFTRNPFWFVTIRMSTVWFISKINNLKMETKQRVYTFIHVHIIELLFSSETNHEFKGFCFKNIEIAYMSSIGACC